MSERRTSVQTVDTGDVDTGDSTGAAPILRVGGLTISFGAHPAVRDVSFSLHRGESLAIVGESGSGKSVTALSILGLLGPEASVESGSISYAPDDAAPRDLLALPPRDLRRIRGGQIAMIFQEPMTSLNPVLTIGEQLLEAINLHHDLSRREARRLAVESLDAVGIHEPARRLRDFPHQFSGGMRQRVMIAMALACEPRVLIADEPTTALDVTVQRQILDLLDRLRRERGLALLLITHDLGIVAERAERICVMQAGRIVEAGPTDRLLRRPLHPYTLSLLRAVPRLDGATTPQPPQERPAKAAPAPRPERPGLLPWLPTAQPPPGGAEDPALLEIEPGRWICGWMFPEPGKEAPSAGPPL